MRQEGLLRVSPVLWGTIATLPIFQIAESPGLDGLTPSKMLQGSFPQSERMQPSAHSPSNCHGELPNGVFLLMRGEPAPNACINEPCDGHVLEDTENDEIRILTDYLRAQVTEPFCY